MSVEKRAHKRFAFSKGSDIRARLVDPDGQGTIETKVLNVSRGGLGLAAGKNAQQNLAAEANMLLEDITGETVLTCLKGHMVQIKWVLDYAPLENLGIGCEFIDLTNECVETLEELFKYEA